MQRVIAVFGSSRTAPDDAAYVDATSLGAQLATAGFAVATGGYGGTMEAVSRGAAGAGGHVIGVTAPPLFPMRSGANSFVAEERPKPTLTERIQEMIHISAAAVALPGSIGTLTELLVAWNDAHISRLSDRPTRPIITVGEPWTALVPSIAADLGTDTDLVTVCGTVHDVVPTLGTALRPT